jgi:hypothetical protein
MATIPSSQKFHTVKSTVDTENRGSASLNAQRTIFTMQDILDTVVVGGGVDGSGTAGKISKWVDSNTLTDSIMAEAGALITVTGDMNLTGEVQCAALTSSGDCTISGNVSAVDVAASGNISGVGGAFSGDVSGVGGAFSGNVSGVDGTFSGDVAGVGGAFSGDVSGVGGAFSGNVSAVDMVASGNLLVGDSTGENPLGINLQQDKGNVAIGLLIHNQNTGADADAKISFETQGQADISIGIDRGDSNKFKISRSGNLGVNDEMSLDADGAVFSTAVKSPTFGVSAIETAPASATAAGVTGDIRFASDAIYVCVATNTWKKADIATF